MFVVWVELRLLFGSRLDLELLKTRCCVWIVGGDECAARRGRGAGMTGQWWRPYHEHGDAMTPSRIQRAVGRGLGGFHDSR